MTRATHVARFRAHATPWDIIVIGGGATGAGIAVDAASRGYDVLLVEQHDFVVPSYDWWEAPFYGLGLKVYNVLAGKYGFGTSEVLSRDETLARLPTIRTEGLRGGVVYYDGQFDDARLLINLIATASEQGATVLNYTRVTALTKGEDGFVDGIVARDMEDGIEHTARARVVINATGPFADEVRQLAEPDAARLIAPSQGIHLVFDRSFLPGDSAIMVPHTRDGRVMFAIPWHGHTVVGTTDTPIDTPTLEPRPLDAEIDFVLETAGRYLHTPPTRADVRSVFVGIRPLVRSGDSRITAALSRDHTIHIDASGLLTTTGGKWTTYRKMAEDTVMQAADLARLPERACVTRTLSIHGFHEHPSAFGALAFYGSDAMAIQGLMRDRPGLAVPLHAALPVVAAEVVWATTMEMARSVEDVLARRTRALFLNARAAIDMAPAVAALMAPLLGHDDAWQREQTAAFRTLAAQYL